MPDDDEEEEGDFWSWAEGEDLREDRDGGVEFEGWTSSPSEGVMSVKSSENDVCFRISDISTSSLSI